ncbi:hypothetical protein [Streptomyces rishiriensis]|uniref:Cell division septation protein DedD n=1 Tax=Streptomyces rishiriensis TaxID=68264 RepID=A0ABU0P2N0_STRRH|nr:hypothetical protein [Streptomyces rishiriensis]MDQ0585614.1 cell division septation protein DedD [Streptomyces rishiriensis]
MVEQKSQQGLPQPLRAAASLLRKVPGAGMVTRAGEDVLDKVGAVSPRGRRIAVYTGAGVLGVAGVVEWPVAVTGAAVAWLTQQHREEPAVSHETSETPGTQGTQGTENEQETSETEEATKTVGEAARSGGAEDADASGAVAGHASATVPTPKVMAGSGKSSPVGTEASSPTPSDKLPAHGEATPATTPGSGGPGSATTRRAGTSG